MPLLRALLVALVVSVASAFSPGVTPLKATAHGISPRHASTVMMPKFLKDLFPDMEKPDDPLGAIKSFFGMKEEEEPPKEETPAPEEEAPPKEEP